MDLRSQKSMAAKILKCGASRIRIDAGTEDARKEIGEALTREDIRILIRKGLIRKVQKKGSSRAKTRKILIQKRKGRRKGTGSRKGGRKTRKKAAWIRTARPLRRFLRKLRDSGQIDKKDYRKLYMRIKGGMFRNKKHLMFYLKEHELLKPIAKRPRKKTPKPKPKARMKTKKIAKKGRREKSNG
jgi:large subunit ribosomal protein L19e